MKKITRISDTTQKVEIPKPKTIPVKLKEVGFWQGDDEPYTIDPHDLVDPSWEKSNRGKIIEYLKNGHVVDNYFGYSWCRFKCGIDDSSMGDADLTDGEWIWPEGLFHYIEKHNVKLPDEFIARMKERGWNPK